MSPRSSNATRSRKKRQILNKFIDLPLDVIYEVLSHVEPLDLLHLARSNKLLRANLMSKRARHAWIAARQNVQGLLPCPEDMSEPAYADLVFCSYCQHCLSTHKTSTYMACRLRICRGCHCVQGPHILPLDCLADLELGMLFPQLDRNSPVASVQVLSVVPAFYGTIVTQNAYDALKTAVTTYEAADLGRFIEECVVRLRKAEEYEDWHKKRVYEADMSHLAELTSKRDVRLNSILRGLEDAGLKGVYDEMSDCERDGLWAIKGTRVAKKLTPSEWERLLPSILSFFAPFQAQQRQRRLEAMDKRFRILDLALSKLLPGVWIKPNLLDIALRCEEVSKIMTASTKVEVTAGDFSLIAI